SRCLFFSAITFLLPSRDSAMSAESFSISALRTARSTGGFGKFGLLIMWVTTAGGRGTATSADALEKPSNGLILFTMDILPPLGSLLSVVGPSGAPYCVKHRRMEKGQSKTRSDGWKWLYYSMKPTS